MENIASNWWEAGGGVYNQVEELSNQVKHVRRYVMMTQDRLFIRSMKCLCWQMMKAAR